MRLILTVNVFASLLRMKVFALKPECAWLWLKALSLSTMILSILVSLSTSATSEVATSAPSMVVKATPSTSVVIVSSTLILLHLFRNEYLLILY